MYSETWTNRVECNSWTQLRLGTNQAPHAKMCAAAVRHRIGSSSNQSKVYSVKCKVYSVQCKVYSICNAALPVAAICKRQEHQPPWHAYYTGTQLDQSRHEQYSVSAHSVHA
jgi:hypothetical protein